MTSDEFTQQTLREQRDKIAKLIADAAIMRGALHLIGEWKLPTSGMGSNDERDHFRGVACKAIKDTS